MKFWVDKTEEMCYNIDLIMRVLFCSDSYYPHPGGVSEYVHYLAAAIRRLGKDVVILAPRYREEYEDGDDVVRIGHCVLLRGNQSTVTFTYDRRLPSLVKDFLSSESFDITHTNGPLGWNLPYWVLHFSRAINVATFHTSFIGFNFYKLAKFAFKGELEKRIDGAIVPSRAALHTIAPHFSLYYRTIPCGVDTERFNPGIEPLTKLPEGIRILFVGRLDPRKGLDRLISAFTIIKQKIPSSLLIVVGKGNIEAYRMMLPHNIKKSVIFEGYVEPDELPRYYASCDVYVSPAIGGETFGIVLLEAMASGIPVIASDIPGYNEVVKDGENGLLFDPTSPEELARVTIELLEDENLGRKIGERARKYALQFSWDVIAERVVDFYEELYNKI